MARPDAAILGNAASIRAPVTEPAAAQEVRNPNPSGPTWNTV